MTPPPRLFARPLLGDGLRALGLAVGLCAVAVVPLLLPTRWILWWVGGYGFVGIWFIVFIALRTRRLMRQPLFPPPPDAPEA